MRVKHDLMSMKKREFWECDVYKMFWKKDGAVCHLGQFKCFLKTTACSKQAELDWVAQGCFQLDFEFLQE